MKKDRGLLREGEPVASATECTGLMPALPGDGRQDDEYASLYAIHPAKDKGRIGAERRRKSR